MTTEGSPFKSFGKQEASKEDTEWIGVGFGGNEAAFFVLWASLS